MEERPRRRSTSKQHRLQHQLEIQSMQIERIFGHHQVPAQVAGGSVESRSISFNLQTQLASGMERLRELKEDLMAALGVSDLHLSREGGQLRLHITKPDEPPVPLLDLLALLPDLPPVTGVLGLAEDGRPVLLDFLQDDVTHVLLCGETGAGKTSLLRSLAVSMALTNRQSQLQLLVMAAQTAVDSTAYTILEPLGYLPHMLASVAHDPEECTEIVTFLVDEAVYRRQQKIAAPTIVVFIDNVVALLEAGGQPALDGIVRLVQRGASAGIHLVMSTQQPEAEVLDSMLKANLPVRLVGWMADDEVARIAAGFPGTQAEYLLGRGDFLAVNGDMATHFQAAYIGDYDLHLSLDELHRQRPPALLAQPYNMRATLSSQAEGGGYFLFDGKMVSMEDSWPGDVVDQAPSTGDEDLDAQDEDTDDGVSEREIQS